MIVPCELPVKKRVFLHLSGGADSALLLYLLADKIKKENLDAQIDCFMIYDKIEMKLQCEILVDYLTDLFPTVKFRLISKYFERNGNNKASEIYRLKLEVLESYDMPEEDTSFLLGITKIYPGAIKKYNGGDSHTRDGRKWIGRSYVPFSHLDKNDLAKIYNELMLDKLFSLTHSCNTKAPIEHCGKCYPCIERLGAFGKL